MIGEESRIEDSPDAVQQEWVNIRDEDPDPVIFGPLEPDPVIFSTDPDSDPTCNIGFIKLFLSLAKYKPESTNSSIK